MCLCNPLICPDLERSSDRRTSNSFNFPWCNVDTLVRGSNSQQYGVGRDDFGSRLDGRCFHCHLGRTIKPSDTIGGEIGIHGVPQHNDSLIDSQSNWTWGCISLKNHDVDELYSVIQIGTVVTIIP